MKSFLPDRSYAVLIGTSRYDRDGDSLIDLPAVAQNVRQLQKLLVDPESVGFHPENVVALLDRPDPTSAAEALADVVERATDTAFVYFSGHGLIDDTGDLHLAMSGSRADRASYTALPLRTINRIMSDCPAQKRILFLDSCYSGRAIEVMGDVTGAIGPEGTYIMASTPSSSASVAEGGFTHELVELLTNGSTGAPDELSLDDIFGHVRRQLMAKALPAPQRSTSGTMGQFVMATNRARQGDLIAVGLIGDRYRLLSVRADGTYRFLDEARQLHGVLYISSMETARWANLVQEVEDLINLPAVREHQLQQFFERNPGFLHGELYQEALPQIVLKRDGAGPLIPDFALKPLDPDGLCDLLDLKLPSKKLLVGSSNRRRLSQAVVEACAQLREYRDYFEVPHNRRLVEEAHGLRFFRPKMIVVIGRRGGVSPVELRRAEGDVPHLAILTYDHLLEQARHKLRAMQGR